MHRWYVLRTNTNYERKVCADLEQRLRNHGLLRHLSEIVIPAQTVTELRDGKQHKVERKLMPGYVLFHGDLNAVRDQLRGIRGLQGFVGAGEVPQTITAAEARGLLGRQTKVERKESALKAGDAVRVIGGPLTDFAATVVEVKGEHLKVEVEIFGRATRADVLLSQVRADRR